MNDRKENKKNNGKLSKVISLPSPFKDKTNKTNKFCLETKMSELEKICGKNGIDWRQHHIGDQTEKERGLRFTPYDKDWYRTYFYLTEEERIKVECEVEKWLDANNTYFELTLRIYKGGSFRHLSSSSDYHSSIQFNKYKAMCPICCDGIESFWVAHSPRWPKPITSTTIYGLIDCGGGLERPNFLKQFRRDISLSSMVMDINL